MAGSKLRAFGALIILLFWCYAYYGFVFEDIAGFIPGPIMMTANLLGFLFIFVGELSQLESRNSYR